MAYTAIGSLRFRRFTRGNTNGGPGSCTGHLLQKNLAIAGVNPQYESRVCLCRARPSIIAGAKAEDIVVEVYFLVNLGSSVRRVYDRRIADGDMLHRHADIS